MTIKERLKVLLGVETSEESKNEEVQFEFQARLEDGTIISTEADAIEVGAIINVVAEDGSIFPLAEGSWKLEDGTEFSVDAEGVVTEVAETEESEEDAEETEEVEESVEEPAEEEVEMSDDTTEEVEDVKLEKEEILNAVGVVMKELLEEVKSDLERLKAEFTEIQSEKLGLEEQVIESEKENTELKSQITELSSEPAGNPATTTKFAKASVKSVDMPTKQEWRNMSTADRLKFNLSKIN